MGSCLARPSKSPTSAPVSATRPQQNINTRASTKATSHGSVQKPVEAKRQSGRQSESRVLGGGPVALQPLKAGRQLAPQEGRDAHQSTNKTSAGAGVGAHAHAVTTSQEDAKEAAFRAAEARAQGVKGGVLSQKLQAQRGKSGQALRMEDSEAERRRREDATLVWLFYIMSMSTMSVSLELFIDPLSASVCSILNDYDIISQEALEHLKKPFIDQLIAMSLKEAARSIPFKQGFLFVCFVGSILALSMLFLSGQGNIGAGAAHLGDEAQEHHH